MMINKSQYILTHVVGGGGIFDTTANTVKRITQYTVGDLASKLLVSAGKSMASQAGKKLASRFIAAPQVLQLSILSSPLTGFTLQPIPIPTQNVAIPQPSVVDPQAKMDEIMSKYAGSGVNGLSPCKGAIRIQDLVRNMHQGSGLKVIYRRSLHSPTAASYSQSPCSIRLEPPAGTMQQAPAGEISNS
jgi:hypothetical protein